MVGAFFLDIDLKKMASAETRAGAKGDSLYLESLRSPQMWLPTHLLNDASWLEELKKKDSGFVRSIVRAKDRESPPPPKDAPIWLQMKAYTVNVESFLNEARVARDKNIEQMNNELLKNVSRILTRKAAEV